MAGTSSGIVAGLTAAALGAVGFLAYRAQATVPAGLAGRPGASASAAAPAAKAPRDRRNPTALPSASGKGERVVYSVDDDRVWLVEEHEHVARTFRVRPGSMDPAVGTYWVSSRSNAATGTDGTPVEHIVRFSSVDGVAIGFSAAVGDGAQTAVDPSVKTGGIREDRADGNAMWNFATIGVKVVVIR
ncbi:hypothetical protein ACFV2Z_00910 [Streptomyces sp. NPDC059688]|uniref:hypothetical protein n=1 Tax=unclassified Streptomyces TaxID=2593676 RepID=UPI000F46AD91|nr:hypothetical protein [Streptomyces sp. PanSC9]ROP51544.1 hypothetical protein EDD94_0968 [Streptomyces sp. PanSC9]